MSKSKAKSKTTKLFGLSLSVTMQRYLVIGISVYLFELLVIVAAQRLGANSVLAVGLAFWLGLLVSFGLQKFVTFGDKRIHHKIVLGQFLAVTLLVFFNFGFTLAVTKLLSPWIPAVLCRTLALGITTLWNFYLYKTKIFTGGQTAAKKPKPKSKPTKAETTPLYLRSSLLINLSSKQARRKLRSRVHSWLSRHARTLTLVGGSMVVLAWTVLRHITNGVNFDVVGQIGLAQQWAHGQMSGAELGATNYLLKIPVYLLVNLLHFLSPMNRLLLLAAVFNVLTFVLLFIIFEKTLKLYAVRQRAPLYLAMAWLATLTGNVFWADYANSRNLETVGGVLLVYLALKYLKQRRSHVLPLIMLIGTVVFFADSLQFYVCGLGLCIFSLARLLWLRHKLALRQSLMIIGSILVAELAARLLLWLAQYWLHVTIMNAPTHALDLSTAGLITTMQGWLVGTFKIFGANFSGGTHGVNGLRQLLNVVGLIIIISLAIKAFFAKRRFVISAVVLTIVITNYLAYAASGQIRQWETQRYLIMVPLLASLLAAFGAASLPKKARLKLQYSWLGLIVITSTLLLGAVVVNWPHRHSQDAHVYQLMDFLRAEHASYALAGREAGVTTTYFGQGQLHVLPMACLPEHILVPTTLFYDQAAFQGLDSYNGNLPIILQDGVVQFGNYSCDRHAIEAQFGKPLREVPVPGVGSALIYRPEQVHLVNLDSEEVKLREQAPSLTRQLAHWANNARLDKLSCPQGMIDVAVAHTDDDILFMTPALTNKLRNGYCVRTIYVTAADDGRDVIYWSYRERGIQSAYAAMLGAKDTWRRAPGTIIDKTVASRSLAVPAQVNLLFLRLADGNVGGQGFAKNNFASLGKLTSGTIQSISTVDGTTKYSYDDLTKLLATIMVHDRPKFIFTQVPGGPYATGDHSDHTAVGHLTLVAAQLAKTKAPIISYLGYPSNNLPANLAPTVAAQKRAIFTTYAADDSMICRAAHQCEIESTYGRYFARSYQLDPLGSGQAMPTNQ